MTDTKTAQAPKAAPKTEPAKAQPKSYTAPHPVQVDGHYYKPGEVFVTAAPEGEGWEEVTPKEAAAIEAATDLIPDDAQFEEAGLEALQAYALIKRVPIVGIAKDRKALITAIKAANEPKL